MKVKIIIGIVIIVLLILTGILLWFSVFNKKNDNLVLTYKIQAGIPFKWEVKIDDESIVKLDKSYVVKDENKGGKVGAAVYTNYEFKGLKEGKTTITFVYTNFVDNKEYEKEKHEVVVDKDLKVTEVKK